MSHRTLFRSGQFNGMWAGMEDVSADTVLVRNFTCRRQGPAAMTIVLYVYPCPTARFSDRISLTDCGPAWKTSRQIPFWFATSPAAGKVRPRGQLCYTFTHVPPHVFLRRSSCHRYFRLNPHPRTESRAHPAHGLE